MITKYKQNNRGVTLYVSIVVTSALLLVSFAIANVTFKQASIASINKDSHIAFFAADSGVECALYWDVKNTTGGSAFATTSTSSISCNENAENPSNPNPKIVGGSATSTFIITFQPETYCAVVSVGKSYENGSLKTYIESRGYNSCDEGNSRRVERAIRVIY